MPDSENGRVTLALVKRDTEYIKESLHRLESKITDLCDEAKTRDERLESLESFARVVKWVGGALAGIGAALLIAWLSSLLGL